MDERESLKLEVERLRTFLKLADIREFTYDIKNDILVNMHYGNEREIFYQGSLSGWEDDYRKNRMDNGEEDNLSSFCRALREGRDHFEIKFSLRGFTRVIKGVTLEEPEGKKVYGVLTVGQETIQLPTVPEDALYKRASDRDSMLNMLNKKAITDYAHRVCENPEGETAYFAIFDLDNFKVVNDTFGHLYGDEVLVTVTEIINRAVGDYGLVGRLGGDEILIITRGIADKAQLRPILREIRSNVESTFKGKMNGFSLTCSIGAVAFPEHAKDYNSVMEMADRMMYLAKEKGKNRYVIYTPEMHHDLILSKEENNTEAHSFVPAFNKIGVLQFLMEEYLRRNVCSNERAFSMVGEAFSLSEVLILYDNGKTCFHWTPDSVSGKTDNCNWIKLNDEFLRLFDENHMLIVDGLYALTQKAPELERELHDRDIQSALFYEIFNKERAEGVILFAKKSQRQKWSEYELLALSTVAKIFEMSNYK